MNNINSMIKLSEQELNNLISNDEEFKDLYFVSALFNKTIEQILIYGLDKETLINLLKTLCANNEDLMQKLIKAEQYKCIYYRVG